MGRFFGITDQWIVQQVLTHDRFFQGKRTDEGGGNRRMHLLLIHQAFTSPGEAGGTRHYELARHLVQKNQGVTIVASDLSYLSGRRTTADRRMVTVENLEGVRVLRAYTYPSLHRSVFGRAVSFLSFMVSSVWAAWKAGPIDLVMGTSPPIFQGVS